MSVTRDFFNSFKTTDFVEGISEVGNQYGLVNSMGDLFKTNYTGQTAVLFDKDYATTSLLPQVRRGEHTSTQGKERNADMFALPLGYFSHSDRLTGQDIQNQRKVGTTEVQDLASATAEKMTDLRRSWDQTQEFMKIQALKGISRSPDGKVMANMFTEFSATQKSIDFLLGTASTSIDTKISELKRHIAGNVKNGGVISGIKILVDNLFFDKLINHANIRSAYNYYQNSGSQINRESQAKYMSYGVVDSFTHKNVEFIAYDASFTLPDGVTQEAAFDANSGLAFATGVPGLFQSWYGPAETLSGANQAGQELRVSTWVDPKDRFVEFNIESAPLHVCMRPSSLVKLTTSN